MQHLVVLSGAGISAESGLKTFRDGDGLWNGYDVHDVATPFAFKKHPQLVLDFYNMRRAEILKAQPNQAHVLLAELENHYKVSIITQNIDDLHERGGSTNVLHLHGEIFKKRSVKNETLISDIISDMHVDERGKDGAPERPHIVWFHEPVPMIIKAEALVAEADLFLIVGTSMQVYPAAGLLDYVKLNIPVYLIDKKIPEIRSGRPIHNIQNTATNGMKELFNILTA